MEKKLNPWLDLCRSVAIVMVILSHGRVFLLPVFPTAQYECCERTELTGLISHPRLIKAEAQH